MVARSGVGRPRQAHRLVAGASRGHERDDDASASTLRGRHFGASSRPAHLPRRSRLGSGRARSRSEGPRRSRLRGRNEQRDPRRQLTSRVRPLAPLPRDPNGRRGRLRARDGPPRDRKLPCLAGRSAPRVALARSSRRTRRPDRAGRGPCVPALPRRRGTRCSLGSLPQRISDRPRSAPWPRASRPSPFERDRAREPPVPGRPRGGRTAALDGPSGGWLGWRAGFRCRACRRDRTTRDGPARRGHRLVRCGCRHPGGDCCRRRLDGKGVRPRLRRCPGDRARVRARCCVGSPFRPSRAGARRREEL